MNEIELKPCPFCGGEIEALGVQCSYEKRRITLDLECRKSGTIFKFKSAWIANPCREAAGTWDRRADHE